MTRYELDLDYRPSTNALSGRASLFVEALEPLSDLVLDLSGLGVDKVSVAGRGAVRYRHRTNRLHIQLGEEMSASARLVVEVQYSGAPGPTRGRWGDIGWEELTDGSLVASQPDGASTWFPCNDVPRHKASYRTTFRVDSDFEVVANGVLVSRKDSGSRTTWVYEQDEPMATYLAAVQIGHYTRRDIAATPVPQTVLFPAEISERVRHDTARQPEMLAAFEKLFGPYPFSGYTVVVTGDDLEMPLEAQGMSVFGANHMDGARGSERLVAHELAHQWFGNSLTAESWRDVWLHEGFACYAEWLWSEAAGGPRTQELAADSYRQLAALPQDILLTDPGPDLMFDDRLYKRGALALHALRRHVGDAAFFGLLVSWTQQHRHANVTTAMFLDHVREHGGSAAADRLTCWLDRTVLPALNR